MKIKITKEQLVEEAQVVACSAHSNQMYDIYPYSKHLKDVVNILIECGYDAETIMAGWLHDSIEDQYLSYNKILKIFGFNVAEMVLAVTDPSDVRNRKEKKIIVYGKIRAYNRSTPVKVADRIANFTHSIRTSNKTKTDMYNEEHEEFVRECRVHGDHDEIWNRLEELATEYRAPKVQTA